MLRKKKGELIPGTVGLTATPSASRKQYKVEGLSEKQNVASLELDVKSKPRWRVVREKLSGGTSEGWVIFGEALVTFLKEDDTVAFSQPYAHIYQHGVVDTSADVSRMLDGAAPGRVFWVFQAPARLIETSELVRYVFTLVERAGVPEGTTLVEFWLEELDRAMLESEKRRFKAAKAGGLHNSVKAIGVMLPSSREAAVASPAPPSIGSQDSKITSMFAIGQDVRAAPSVLHEDRFPCSWIEWKTTLSALGASLLRSDESIWVVLVPMPAGVFIMNPSSDGNADFLGELICIPWQRVRSHGSTPKFSSLAFKAVCGDGRETTFVFRSPKIDVIDALFTKYIYLRAEERFPARWPPLRYLSNDRHDLDRPGVNVLVSPRKLSPRK